MHRIAGAVSLDFRNRSYSTRIEDVVALLDFPLVIKFDGAGEWVTRLGSRSGLAS
jgi:hypothetical protein